MFYNQPLATRFGTDLIRHIETGVWQRLDIAVAWVRESGVKHLDKSITKFLSAGNELNIVVGIDLDNTTKEGLESLLALHKHGPVSIVIHHNESGPIFHPKLYLFRNDSRAKLIVGSNNITEAGLFLNTEAGLELDVPVDDKIIVSAINALEAWRDATLGLARQLDKEFLEALVENGYLKEEATLRAEATARRARSGTTRAGLKKLFKGVPVTRPSNPLKSSTISAKKHTPTSATKLKGDATGHVLLMRVRTARGTQVQIPLTVLREPFFVGVSQVTSASDGNARGIHPTHAKRAKSSNPNTLKLEMPETRGLKDPVVRFEFHAT